MMESPYENGIVAGEDGNRKIPLGKFYFSGDFDKQTKNSEYRSAIENVLSDEEQICVVDKDNNYISDQIVIETTPLLSGHNNSTTAKRYTSGISDTNKNGKLQFRNLTHRQKFVLILTCIAFMLEGISFSVIAPFFPIEAQKRGMSLSLTGFVFSEFQLVTFILSPVLGANMNNLGHKFVSLLGLFVAGSCTILFGTLDKCPSGTPFIALSFACRTIEAIGFTAYYNSLISFAVSEFPDSISTTLGIVYTVNSIGMMIGPALGGLLYELGGYPLPFFVVGGAVLLSIIFFGILMPDMEFTGPEVKSKSSSFSMLKTPTVIIAILIAAVSSVTRNFINPILSPHLETFGLSEGLVGFVFVLPMLVLTCSSPLWGYLTDFKYLTMELLVFGHLLYFIGYLLIGPSSSVLPFLPSSLWVVIIGLIFIGISGGITMPAFKLIQAGASIAGFDKDSVDTLSMVTGLMATGYSLGAFAGTAAAGAIADGFGYENAFTIVSAFNAFMALVLILYFVGKRQQLNKYLKH